MFSEVKSENDRLSDTQRLWIHVLTGAGVRVELCAAVAKRDNKDVKKEDNKEDREGYENEEKKEDKKD
jgi:VRR-NUC domain